MKIHGNEINSNQKMKWLHVMRYMTNLAGRQYSVTFMDNVQCQKEKNELEVKFCHFKSKIPL